MSRWYVSSSKYFYNSAAQASSGVVTLGFWIYPFFTVAAQVVWSVAKGSVSDVHLQLGVEATAKVRSQLKSGGSTYGAVTTETVTLNAWNFIGLLWQPQVRLRAYLGSEIQTTSMAGVSWPSGIDQTGLGFQYDSTPEAYSTGLWLGPWALWTVALPDAVMAQFAARRNFRSFPAYWPQAYYDMTGTDDVTDQIGSFDFTEVGSVGEQGNPEMHRLDHRVVSNVIQPAMQVR